MTDAAIVLGMLGASQLAGGIALDIQAAKDAYDRLADELGMSGESAARAVVTIVTAAMANAIREVTIERGEDPREATLMPFGGAGPLFACLLARELGIPQIVVPPYAGNFSASGLLGTDVVHTASRTRVIALDSPNLVPDLESEVRDLFEHIARRDRVDLRDWEREVGVDARYVGQEHTLTLELQVRDGTVDVDTTRLGEAFAARYHQVFNHSMDERAEIVSVRATLRQRLPDPTIRWTPGPSTDPSSIGRSWPGRTSTYSFAQASWTDFEHLQGESLEPGDEVTGPSIISEAITTSYLDVGWSAQLHECGALFLTQSQKGAV